METEGSTVFHSGPLKTSVNSIPYCATDSLYNCEISFPISSKSSQIIFAFIINDNFRACCVLICLVLSPRMTFFSLA